MTTIDNRTDKSIADSTGHTAARVEHIDFASRIDVESARAALAGEGAHIALGLLPESVCDQMISIIDAHQERARTERNYADTELRVWDAEHLDPLLRAFRDESDRLLTAIEGRSRRAYTLLAIRNRPVDTADASLVQGRWHIDSLSRQVKVFAFLTSTTAESGPFEYVPGTQSWSFKLRMLVGGHYLAPTDVIRGSRAYSSVSDNVLARLKQTPAGVSVECPRGSIMVVDTSALHRARPCVRGSRYALTAYYR